MSTRYNTGNPIESTDVRDMSDNAKNFDEFSNSTSDSFTDRLGRDRQTIEGSIRKAGFQPASFDFVTGGTLVSGDRNKAVFNPSPTGDNNWYAWQGSFPKIISPNSTTSTSGGLGENAWKPVTNSVLAPTVRESIRRSYEESGFNLVDGSFQRGFTLVNANDVALDDATGKAYSGVTGVYPAGTLTAGFTDRSGDVFASFRTVNEMMLSESMANGSRVRTSKHILSVISEWEVVDTLPATYSVSLANGLFAKLVSDDGDIRHYGAAPYPTDCRAAIQAAVDHVNGYFAPKGVWACIGSVPLKRSSWVRGVGCLQGIGSDIAAKLPIGSDLHPYTDGGEGYPQGGVCIENILFTNDIAADYLSFPDPALVISSQNRAFWAVHDQPYVDPSTWLYKKTGGENCPHLKVRNVNCRNFLIGIDAHTWMSEIEGLQGRYCGVTARLYGTSTTIKQLWPQYPLLAGAQLRLEYSSLESSSAGERPVTGYTPSVYGVELHGGNMTLSDVGMELACKAQFRIYNGKYRIENPWSSVVAGFKPKYIYDIAAYPDLTLSDFFDYRYYQTALMRTNRRDNVDGIKLTTPIYPWFLSAVGAQFNVWNKVTEDGGDKFIGVFGKSLVQQNGVQLLPFCRDNYTTNASANVDTAKAEYIAEFDSTLVGSALYQHRVVVDGSGFQTGDTISGKCSVIPMVGALSDGTIAKYPATTTDFEISWSAAKTTTGFDSFVTQAPSGVTATVNISGTAGQETVQFQISVTDSTMTAAQKAASMCRFIDRVRTTSPGGTTKDYIAKVARS